MTTLRLLLPFTKSPYLIDSERSILHSYRPDRLSGSSDHFASLVAVMYNNHLYPVLGVNAVTGIVYRADRLFLAMNVQHPPGGKLSIYDPLRKSVSYGKKRGVSKDPADEDEPAEPAAKKMKKGGEWYHPWAEKTT